MKISREAMFNGLAALVLLLVAVWFVRSTEWVEVDVRTPRQGPAVKDPRHAMKQVFERLGLHVSSPPNLDRLPPANAALVLHSLDWNIFPERDLALRRWVEGGGRLLIATWQQPNWVPVRQQRTAKPAQPASAGNATSPARPNADEDDDEDDDAPAPPPPPARLRPPGPGSDGCQNAQVSGDGGSGRQLKLCHGAFGFALHTTRNAPVRWQIDTASGAQVLTAGVGRGSVTVFTGAMTDNDAVLRGDNAGALVAALGLQRGDGVWFVDSESRTPLLTLVWQRGMPAVLLFALLVALVWWRQGVRFGPRAPVPPLARRSVAEQIRGTAHFIFQRDSASLHRAQLRALEGTARRRIRDHDRLDRRARAEAIARATALEAGDLARAMDPTLKRTRRELLATLALLETAVRRLALNP
jgi:hypothetical protein